MLVRALLLALAVAFVSPPAMASQVLAICESESTEARELGYAIGLYRSCSLSRDLEVEHQVTFAQEWERRWNGFLARVERGEPPDGCRADWRSSALVGLESGFRQRNQPRLAELCRRVIEAGRVGGAR